MLKVLAAVLALTPLVAAAETCGGAEAPCTIEGGYYHAAAPDRPGPHPAVFFLHGWGGVAAKTIANMALVEPLLARGYAVIAPQGMPRGGGHSGGSWNSFADPARRDDVAFLRAVLADAAGRFAVNPARVIAAGFSGGGMMAWRVACDAPESFAAYAPIAGLLWRPLPERCAGPVRMLHTHGWADKVVPIEGRSVAGGRITQGDLFVGLDILRAANGCARDDPDAYPMDDTYWRRRWSGCAPGSALEFALHPGGHAIPKGWSTMVLDWYEGLGAATD